MRLQKEETMLHELKPAPGLLVLWAFSKCLFPAIALSIAAGFVGFLWQGIAQDIFEKKADAATVLGPVLKGVTVGGMFGLVMLVLFLVYSVFLFHTYRYYVTNQRCVFHGGILRQIERSVPYHKVTDVERSRTIFERLVGVSSLGIFTLGTGSMPAAGAGNSRPEILFSGLRDNETPAESIHAILRGFRSTGE